MATSSSPPPQTPTAPPAAPTTRGKRTFSINSNRSAVQSFVINEAEPVSDFYDAQSRVPSRQSPHRPDSVYKGRPASIDQSRRPQSARRDSAQPYIGTFQFEHEMTDASPISPASPSKDKELETSGSGDNSSGDVDLEQQKQGGEKDKEQHDEKDPNVVDWDGPDDPENPQNWSWWRKAFLTLSTGILTFVITFASSIFSTATMQTSKEFGVSTEVMTLGTALFILGFAFGPIVWGPFSELYGRKIPLFAGYFIFGIFQIPVALATNLQTIFICRFFGGFFGSSPLAIVGGFLGDLWDPASRGIAMSVFSGATFIGPVAGPIVGSFVTESYLGWRWTEWITAILGLSVCVTLFFFVPETFAPLLLSRRAKKIRFATKNWAVRAPLDEKEVSVTDLATRYLMRPFTMLALEPILLLITLYMSLVYGILYGFFEAYPIAFQDVRGLSPGLGSLPFAAIIVGVAGGVGVITYTTLTRVKPKMEAEGHVTPEERLIPMMIGAVLMPIGLFWFAWTSNPGINLWPQILAGVPMGMGVMLIFLQGLNYILDTYGFYGNSAIAANTFARSWVGAGFPLFITYMYQQLGVNWATSLLGFLCIALLPCPFLFYIYGHKIRKMSRYSPT